MSVAIKDKDAFIIDQWNADDGSVYFGIVTKNRRLSLRRMIDGRHVAINLDGATAERLGTTLGKYLNHMREIQKAEALL